jgi:hypothetical protein
MALRFLADHCVSNSTIQTIQEANHEVLRLRDVLPVESPLFNREGKVIGINFAVLRDFGGSNLAVPVKYAQDLLK